MDKRSEEGEFAILAIENAFQVSITLHDLRGTIRHSDGRVFLPKRHRHRHPCCVYRRMERPGWDDRCYHDCFTRSEQSGSGEYFVKNCWKGCAELVVPLVHEKHHMLTIYAGLFRSTEVEAKDIPDDEEYLELLGSLPQQNAADLAELASLLKIFGHGLLHRLCREEELRPVDRGFAIRNYVDSNAHLPVSIHDLARHLNLSPSRASHTVREHTGMTFTELLLKERMLRAENLLTGSRKSQEEIAESVGFQSVYYFNRVFRAYFSLPPGEYRKRKGST